MKKIKLSNLIRLAVIVFLAIGAFSYFKNDMGKPIMIKMDGMEIELGKTKCSVLTDNGYKLGGTNYTKELEANSWQYLIDAVKDGKTKPSLTVYNDGKTAAIEDCKLGGISLHKDSFKGTATIGDVEITAETTYKQIEEKYKDFKDINSYEKYIKLTRGKYEVEIRFEDGADKPWTSIFATYDFGKSYKTK